MRSPHDQAARLFVGAHASIQGQPGGIYFIRGVGQRREYSRISEGHGSPDDQAVQRKHRGRKGGGEGIRRSSLIAAQTSALPPFGGFPNLQERSPGSAGVAVEV